MNGPYEWRCTECGCEGRGLAGVNANGTPYCSEACYQRMRRRRSAALDELGKLDGELMAKGEE